LHNVPERSCYLNVKYWSRKPTGRKKKNPDGQSRKMGGERRGGDVSHQTCQGSKRLGGVSRKVLKKGAPDVKGRK